MEGKAETPEVRAPTIGRVSIGSVTIVDLHQGRRVVGSWHANIGITSHHRKLSVEVKNPCPNHGIRWVNVMADRGMFDSRVKGQSNLRPWGHGDPQVYLSRECEFE
jgi:hypothetical protein